MSYAAVILVVIALILVIPFVQHRLYLARLSRLRKVVRLTTSNFENGSWKVGSNLYISWKLTRWMKEEEMAAYCILVEQLIQKQDQQLRVEMGDDTRGPFLKLIAVS